jgi:hypothetical protein
MKILYISKKAGKPIDMVDYQDDCLFIGLKELFGADVVDVNPRIHIYKDFPYEEARNQYGKGFTVTRTLDPDDSDREDIVKKIKNKYFDYVVYGSVWRCQDYLETVLEHYDKEKVVFVDGEDNTKFHPLIREGARYFKRECIWENNAEYQQFFGKVNQIGFGFPTFNVVTDTKKEKRMAHVDPRDRKTYVFKDEAPYYQDYQVSKYAFTMSKAGWDCLRHWEIIGNGCVPIFLNIANSPRFVMTRAPKALMTKIEFFFRNEPKYLDREYEYYQSEIVAHFMKYNTTKGVAEYFLSDLSKPTW